MYYLYVLMDSSKPGKYIYGGYKFEFEPFYVGKGTGNRIKYTLYDKSSFKMNKIKKLKRNNIEIISYIVVNGLSNEESIKMEIELIKLIGRRDINEGTLVNMTDGGDGRLNSSPSEETKNKISKTNRKRYKDLFDQGISFTHSEETKLKMSIKQAGRGNGFYGKTHTEEVKLENSIRVGGTNHPMYNIKHSENTRKILKEKRSLLSNDKLKESCQKFNKKVLMYDLNMNFIEEFESVKLTSIKTGINESIISKCCRGDIKDPTRYFFKYKERKDRIKNNKFIISIGDKFKFNNINYILVKRNRKTCVCDDGEKLINIRFNDFKYLFEKDTNNSDMIEMYLFLRSVDNSFKIKKNIISNGRLVINFIKLVDNSEIFKDRKDISNLYGKVIFEDEWIFKKDIVKSRLLNLLGRSERIYARKCNIKKVDNKEVREFLVSNHIQGFVGSRVKLGLYYNDELVSLITFGNLRKNLGQSSKDGSYELLRFCNKLNTSVIGGASKLFKYFLNNYDQEYIISYADKRWSDGGLYEKLGFCKSIKKSIPNYFYIIEGKREGRFKYRKDKLIDSGFDGDLTEIQIQHQRGYYRIFDSGSFKYEYHIKS